MCARYSPILSRRSQTQKHYDAHKAYRSHKYSLPANREEAFIGMIGRVERLSKRSAKHNGALGLLTGFDLTTDTFEFSLPSGSALQVKSDKVLVLVRDCDVQAAHREQERKQLLSSSPSTGELLTAAERVLRKESHLHEFSKCGPLERSTPEKSAASCCDDMLTSKAKDVTTHVRWCNDEQITRNYARNATYDACTAGSDARCHTPGGLAPASIRLEANMAGRGLTRTKLYRPPPRIQCLSVYASRWACGTSEPRTHSGADRSGRSLPRK